MKKNANGFIDIEIKDLLDWTGKGPEGCIASNKITKEGWNVGYMYREQTNSNNPDSGWMFLKGDEDEDYMNNASNFNVFALNTICNYDSTIIQYLDAPTGTAFIRISETEFEIDKQDKPIYFSKQNRE